MNYKGHLVAACVGIALKAATRKKRQPLRDVFQLLPQIRNNSSDGSHVHMFMFSRVAHLSSFGVLVNNKASCKPFLLSQFATRVVVLKDFPAPQDLQAFQLITITSFEVEGGVECRAKTKIDECADLQSAMRTGSRLFEPAKKESFLHLPTKTNLDEIVFGASPTSA